MERERLESFTLSQVGPSALRSIVERASLEHQVGLFRFALLRQKYVELGVEVKLLANSAGGFAAIAEGNRNVAVGQALALSPDDDGASGKLVQLVFGDFYFFEVRVFAEIVEGHIGAGVTVRGDAHRLHRVVDAFQAKTWCIDFVGSGLCGFGKTLAEV